MLSHNLSKLMDIAHFIESGNVNLLVTPTRAHLFQKEMVTIMLVLKKINNENILQNHIILYYSVTHIKKGHIPPHTVCVVCVSESEKSPAKQMGIAAVLPRLFHDSIPNNKSLLNAKMNTFKLFRRGLHSLPGIILQQKTILRHLISVSGLILSDCRNNFIKQLYFESIYLRTSYRLLK